MSDTIEVALVTGASGGIGLEIARLLAGDGKTLFLTARSADRLEELAAQLRSRHAIKVHHAAIDLSRPDGPQRVAEAVAARHLHVDMLVNNAGVGLLGPFHQTSRKAQLDLVRLDVMALVDLTHRFVGAMVERGRGAILNVASTAGFSPGPLMSSYFASKAFVLSFSEGLARELEGTGVVVTALCPGPVRTGFQAQAGIPASSLPAANTLEARIVAKAGLDGVRTGKRVVVPGLTNKVLTFLARKGPRRLVTEATYRIQSSRLSRRG